MCTHDPSGRMTNTGPVIAGPDRRLSPPTVPVTTASPPMPRCPGSITPPNADAGPGRAAGAPGVVAPDPTGPSGGATGDTPKQHPANSNDPIDSAPRIGAGRTANPAPRASPHSAVAAVSGNQRATAWRRARGLA